MCQAFYVQNSISSSFHMAPLKTGCHWNFGISGVLCIHANQTYIATFCLHLEHDLSSNRNVSLKVKTYNPFDHQCACQIKRQGTACSERLSPRIPTRLSNRQSISMRGAQTKQNKIEPHVQFSALQSYGQVQLLAGRPGQG